MSATASRPTAHRSSSIYLAFIPWVLFSFLAERVSFTAGAVSALAAAILISVPSLLHRRPKLLELGGIAAFAVFSIAAFFTDASVGDDLTRYGRGIAAGLLALIALGSLLWTPFTEQYARETVPREYLGVAHLQAHQPPAEPMWGLVFLAMLPSHLIAGTLGTQRANLIFNWLIPVLLVVWAVKRMGRITGDDAVPAAHDGVMPAAHPA